MTPPSMRVATPCRTAFSTSGCRISGGTARVRAVVRDRRRHLKPLAESDALDLQVLLGKRHFAAERDARGRAKRSCCPAGSRAIAGTSRGRGSGSAAINPTIEFRLLNRKWGST